MDSKVECPFCGQIFQTPIKKGLHQRLCQHNPNRERMLQALRNAGRQTFTKLNKARTLQRKQYLRICPRCQKQYSVTCTESEYLKGRFKQFCSRHCANVRHPSEAQKRAVRDKLLKHTTIKHCNNCKAILSYRNKSGYCKKCISKFRVLSDATKQKLREAGFKSCQIQANTRRSKNQIAFYQLCKEHFNVVTHNNPIFNGWDADIIIEDIKVAILWNGKWHYQKLKREHSVEQVQNRDKIKIQEIEKCGYHPYTIKDMGKYSIDKVQTQFNTLLEYIKKIN